MVTLLCAHETARPWATRVWSEGLFDTSDPDRSRALVLQQAPHIAEAMGRQIAIDWLMAGVPTWEADRPAWYKAAWASRLQPWCSLVLEEAVCTLPPLPESEIAEGSLRSLSWAEDSQRCVRV